MRALRLLLGYWRVGLMAEIQYRANLALQVLQSLLSLLVGVVSIDLVFRQTQSLGGWSRWDLFVLMGIHLAVGSFVDMLVAPNMQRLVDEIQQGMLDFALVKPVDAQAHSSIREVRIWRGLDALLGVGVVAYALDRGGVGPVPWGWAIFPGFVIAGCLAIYDLWLILAVLSFWITKTWNLFGILQNLFQASRWPISSYPRWLRFLLTFVVPVSIVVNVPAEIVLGRISPAILVVAAVVAVVLTILARIMWRLGLQHYRGASA